MLRLKQLARQWIHQLGFEVYRYPQSSERLEPHLRVLLKTHNIDSIIDVGANVGQFAHEIRHLLSNVPMYSVEPNPEAFQKLREASENDAAWKIYNVALG